MSVSYAQVALLKDINPSITIYHSLPQDFTEMNGALYFRANPGHLWKTDGTETGSIQITPSNFYLQEKIVFQNFLYLVGTESRPSNSNNKYGLWRMEETPENTYVLTDIKPEITTEQRISNLILANDVFYFVVNGLELWKSDGTSMGTVLVKDGFVGAVISQLIYIDGTLFFAASDDIHGRELWKSNGTAESTAIVKNIHETDESNPSNFIELEGMLYFSASNGLLGRELWKSDGTADGTEMVSDINPNAASSNPQSLVVMNNTLFFVATEGSKGMELWKSNGTAETTSIVRDIAVGLDHSWPANLINISNTLFFSANTTSNGYELWKSNGTPEGTERIKEFSFTESEWFQKYHTEVNGTLYFVAKSDVHGKELWKSDGTEAGTILVRDINSGTPESNPHRLVSFNGVLYFAANDGEHGIELWRSDGTLEGTRIVKDIAPNTGIDSNPKLGCTINGIHYFKATTNAHGTEVWKTDGTPEGTEILADLVPGEGSSDPNSFLNVDGTLYIFTQIIRQNAFKSVLWKSDGTRTGTVEIKEFDPGVSYQDAHYYPVLVGSINGILYFKVNDGVHGSELWRSDGTPEGTTIVKDINPNDWRGSNAQSFVQVNNVLYFSAHDGVHGSELWRSDGTESGTFMVKDIFPELTSSSPNQLTVVEDQIYFNANDGIHGVELWRSNGTASGTHLVKDINLLNSPNNGVSHLTEMNGVLYFSANDNEHDWELWRSDGTPDGTVMIQDINPQGAGVKYYFYTSTKFVVQGDEFYFTATNGTDPIGLWKSDGTADGTQLVKNFDNQSNDTFPYHLKNVNGSIYFIARGEESSDNYIWKSDGLACNTVPVASTRGFAINSPFSSLDTKLIFPAWIQEYGRELFYYETAGDPRDAACEQMPVTILLPSTTEARLGDTITIPITVSHFTNMVSAQFNLEWDPAVVTFLGVEQFGLPGLDEQSFGLTQTSAGQLTFSWTAPGLVGQNLNTGETIFSTRFRLTGAPGNTSSYNFTEPLEFVGTDFTTLPYQVNSGTITIASTALMEGTVSFYNEGLADVTVAIENENAESPVTVLTDQAGHFSTSIPAALDYSLTLSKPTVRETYLSYLNAADIAAIRRHILQTQLLESPYQKIAADVNQNQSISTLDLVLIEAVLLGLQPTLPNEGQWKFLSADFVIDPALPFYYPTSTVFPEVIEDVNQRFVALHLGDVIDSREHSSGRKKEDNYTLEITPMQPNENGEVLVAVRGYGFSQSSAWQASLEWNDLEFVSIENNTVGVRTHLRNNQLTMIWDDVEGESVNFSDGTVFLMLKFKAGKMLTKEHFALSPSLEALAFDATLKADNLSLRFVDQQEFIPTIGAPFPNPFKEELQLIVTLKEVSDIQFSIQDVHGRSVYASQSVGIPGVNVLRWAGKNDGDKSLPPGVYTIKVQTDFTAKTFKIIRR